MDGGVLPPGAQLLPPNMLPPGYLPPKSYGMMHAAAPMPLPPGIARAASGQLYAPYPGTPPMMGQPQVTGQPAVPARGGRVVGGDRRIPSYGGNYRYAREDKGVEAAAVRIVRRVRKGGP